MNELRMTKTFIADKPLIDEYRVNKGVGGSFKLQVDFF